MDIGSVNIDLSYALVFFQERTAFEIVMSLIANIGWIVLAYFLLYLMVYFWKEYKQEIYKKDWKWVLLAIDVPSVNMQTPKAVEQMFSHLAGAYSEPNIADKFRAGFKKRSRSWVSNYSAEGQQKARQLRLLKILSKRQN